MPNAAWIKNAAPTVLVVLGVLTYVTVAGTTGSCPACAAITRLAGFPGGDRDSARPGPREGEFAPAWTAQTPDGKVVRAEDFAGKVVLINFWATWCGPCRAEVPDLVALQRKHEAKGVAIVGVSLDETSAAVARFAQETAINFPVVMGTAQMTADFGGVRAIPTTVVLDRQGRIIGRRTGALSAADAEAMIKPLL